MGLPKAHKSRVKIVNLYIISRPKPKNHCIGSAENHLNRTKSISSHIKREKTAICRDFLGLLDFEMFPEEPEEYIHHVDEMCHRKKFFPKIQKVFVEIEKFFELENAGKTESDNSEAAQWLRAIKAIIKEEPVPEQIMKNDTFKRLLKSVKLINFAEEVFNLEVGNMTDLQAVRESSFIDGKAEGHEDALAVAQEMNLSSEQIAEFKARLDAKTASSQS